MNSLVFVTYDITPVQWTSFTQAAGIYQPDPYSQHAYTDPSPIVPYILIHSRNQEDVTSSTREISSPIKSEFVGADWTYIRDVFLALTELDVRVLFPNHFLVLDSQSHKEQKAVIWVPSIQYGDKDGEEWEPYRYPKPGLLKYQKWERLRVPYARVEEYIYLFEFFHSDYDIVEECLEEAVKELVGEVHESDFDSRGYIKEPLSKWYLTTAEINN